MLERDLRFSILARLSLLRAVVAFAVTVGWALATRSAWSLVLGALAAEVVTTAGSYVAAGGRPHPSLDVAEWKRIVSFGRWVTMSSVLVYGIVNLDDLVVGRLLGPAQLAQYQIAYLLSNAAATEISLVVNRVLLPSLARTQDRMTALRSSFVQAYEVTATLATATAATIAVAGGPILVGALGDDWRPAAGVVWLLSLWGAIRALGAATSPALLAIGRPELVTTFHLAMLIPMAILVVPLTDRFELTGAAAAIAIPNVVVLALRLPRVGRALGCASLELYKRLAPSLVAMAAALLAGAGVRLLVVGPPLAEGAVAGAATLLSYGLALTVVDRLLGGSARSSVSRAVRLLLGRAR
jgi:PST family polysaccharide transporter/lipopolysaccharide exporter